MSAISSYSQIPTSLSPLTDEKGDITNIWQLFFNKLASGVFQVARFVPITGFSFSIPQGARNVICDPAGVLASGTFVFPPSATDGQNITITTSQTVTSATFSPNAGQTVVNAPTTITAGHGQSVSFIFSQQSATWYTQ